MNEQMHLLVFANLRNFSHTKNVQVLRQSNIQHMVDVVKSRARKKLDGLAD